MNEMIIFNDLVCIKFMGGILNIRLFFIWFLFLSDRVLKIEIKLLIFIYCFYRI